MVSEVYLTQSGSRTVIPTLPVLQKVRLLECILYNEFGRPSNHPGYQYLNPLWELVYMISGWKRLESLKVTMHSGVLVGYYNR